jgi:hypothetical protein
MWFELLRLISISPPAILPARAFLSKFISLLSSNDPGFVTTTLTHSGGEMPFTSSSTLNWLQLAILTVQRAPAEGVSGVQARGTTGGVAREWESLIRKYKGQDKVIGSQAVQEVCGWCAMLVQCFWQLNRSNHSPGSTAHINQHVQDPTSQASWRSGLDEPDGVSIRWWRYGRWCPSETVIECSTDAPRKEAICTDYGIQT